jgi:hypothetical protein
VGRSTPRKCGYLSFMKLGSPLLPQEQLPSIAGETEFRVAELNPLFGNGATQPKFHLLDSFACSRRYNTYFYVRPDGKQPGPCAVHPPAEKS